MESNKIIIKKINSSSIEMHKMLNFIKSQSIHPASDVELACHEAMLSSDGLTMYVFEDENGEMRGLIFFRADPANNSTYLTTFCENDYETILKLFVDTVKEEYKDSGIILRYYRHRNSLFLESIGFVPTVYPLNDIGHYSLTL